MPNRNRPLSSNLVRNLFFTFSFGLILTFTVSASQGSRSVFIGPGTESFRSAPAIIGSCAAPDPAGPMCPIVTIPHLTSFNGVDIIVPVNTTDITGRGALSADIRVSYDPNILVPGLGSTFGVKLGTVGNSNGGGRLLTVSNLSPGLLEISVFGTDEFQGSGDLINMDFTVVGLPGAVSPVNFTIFKYNEGNPCSLPVNGSVTVISGTITGTISYGNIVSPPAFRGVPGVSINGSGAPAVSAVPTGSSGDYSLSGFGAGTYTITPSKTGGQNAALSAFDAAKIAQWVVDLIPLNPIQLQVADVSGNGGVTAFDASMIARYVVLLPGTGLTGDWIFNPVNVTHNTVYQNIMGENYTALLMGDVSGNWNDPTSLPGGRPASQGPEKSISLKAPYILTRTDGEVVVPVTVEGTANKGIISYEFDLRYDPSVIQPLPDPVGTSGTISGGFLAASNVETPGLLRVAAYGAMPLTGDGVLLNLRFTTVGAAGSVSPLTWERLMLNEGSLRTTVADGEVELSLATPDRGAISGRLLTPQGQGVPGARITLTDSTGRTNHLLSNGFGIYRFGQLETAQTYTISVESRLFVFKPVTVSVTGQSVIVDIIAEP